MRGIIVPEDGQGAQDLHPGVRQGHDHHGLLLVLGRVLVMLAHHDAEPGDTIYWDYLTGSVA